MQYIKFRASKLDLTYSKSHYNNPHKFEYCLIHSVPKVKEFQTEELPGCL